MPHGTLSEQPPTDHFRHVYVELYVALDVSIVIVNIFPIATVFACRKRRVPLDELIVALSVSYLLAALIPSPLGLAAYITQQWYGGAWTCALYQVTVTWLQLVAMCLVTSMCLDRWLALRYVIGDVTPRAPPNDQRRKRVRYVIAAVYVGCLVLATLPLTGLAPPALSASGRLCRTWVTAPVTMPRHHVSYVVFLVVGYANVVVAFGSNVASIAMLCRLRRRSCDRSLYRILSGPDRQTLVEFTAMTSLLSLVFYVAWVPSLAITSADKGGVDIPTVVMQASQMCTVLTGLLNPLIYAALARPYRVGYVRCLRAASRLLFGCPVTYAEVLSDLTGQTTSCASTGSAATPRAALLSTTGSDSDLEPYNQQTDVDDNDDDDDDDDDNADDIDDVYNDDRPSKTKLAHDYRYDMQISTVSDVYNDTAQQNAPLTCADVHAPARVSHSPAHDAADSSDVVIATGHPDAAASVAIVEQESKI